MNDTPAQKMSGSTTIFRTLIPRNAAHFLYYAAALILLRKVGGGYVFVHRYLLAYSAVLKG